MEDEIIKIYDNPISIEMEYIGNNMKQQEDPCKHCSNNTPYGIRVCHCTLGSPAITS